MRIFDKLFNIKNENAIYAPVKGYCFDVNKSEDKTFRDKLIGDGFIVIPNSEIICSPCNGTVKMIFPSLHAFGIVDDNNQEILVHIGTNTVELNGECFEKLAEINQRVRNGEPIIRFNYKKAAKLGYDICIYTILVSKQNVNKINLNKEVDLDDVIIEDDNANH